MKAHPVVFITVMDYDNLGVGYMASLLSAKGFDTQVLDFSIRESDILKILQKADPLIIGFSVIFHNYIDKFAELIRYLREKGINCHFTAGGHYASLRYEELFMRIPELDSIVRFEGEYPVVELAKCISREEEWREIPGIAYVEIDKITANPVCPPETDLDIFPFPLRTSFKNYAFGRKVTSILAGRGCIYNCTFCNTREFYRQASAPVKRIRKPEAVVSEMEYLFNEKGCSVFLFHDDDFPVRSSGKHGWIKRFCKELKRKGLSEKLIWKINCRPDEIDEECFAMMKQNGLFLVFLGIEDGTDTGLKRMNKQMSVADSIIGINTLKKLEIGFDFGYILFQPVTTFRSLKENIGFLRHVCSDGYTPSTFLKLVPFYDTRVEKELADEGRLRISDFGMDYDFIEEGMGEYYNFVTECFNDWRDKPDGVENISKWARNYFSVYSHFFDIQPEVTALENNFRRLVSESNTFMLDTMSELALIFETNQLNMYGITFHEIYRGRIKAQHSIYRAEIITTMTELMNFVEDRQLAK